MDEQKIQQEVQQAIASQIGAQVIEAIALQVRLRRAQEELARVETELAEAKKVAP